MIFVFLASSEHSMFSVKCSSLAVSILPYRYVSTVFYVYPNLGSYHFRQSDLLRRDQVSTWPTHHPLLREEGLMQPSLSCIYQIWIGNGVDTTHTHPPPIPVLKATTLTMKILFLPFLWGGSITFPRIITTVCYLEHGFSINFDGVLYVSASRFLSDGLCIMLSCQVRSYFVPQIPLNFLSEVIFPSSYSHLGVLFLFQLS